MLLRYFTTPPSLEPVQDDSHLVSCHFPLAQGKLPE